MCMEKKKGYEVIRFIERGTFCHASLDYVEGITLYDWVSSHENIDKNMFYMWMKELLQQLVLFHNQRGAPCYGKLNPYNVVIMRKGKIALIAEPETDAGRTLDKYFIPIDDRQNIDVYCMGKLIQFIMAHLLCEPRLSKMEEYKLQKIVKKCLETGSKKRYADIQIVQAQFNGTKKLKFDRKIIIMATTMLIIICAMWTLRKDVFGKEISVEGKRKDDEQTAVYNKSDQKKISEESARQEESEKEIFLQAGIDYFLENEEYEKSKECLLKADIQEDKTQLFLKLAEFMAGDKSDTDIQNIYEELQQIEWKGKQVDELLALLRVHDQIKIESQSTTEYEIIEAIKGNSDNLSTKLQREYILYQANMYENLKKWKEASECYEKLQVINQERKDEIQSCVRKFVDMEEQYITHLWNDTELNEEEKLEEIKKVVAQLPDMLQKESFKEFLIEQKIHIEEGKVWVERLENVS